MVELLKTLFLTDPTKENLMAHRQSGATRQSEYKMMTKTELLKIIARYHLCYHLDDDNRAVYDTDAWAHLSKNELAQLASACR